MTRTSVHAVVVTYNPDITVLSKQLELLRNQTDRIWLVDNYSEAQASDWKNTCRSASKINLIQLEKNLGLGFAQNTGIRAAKEAGASHVLIMDQDSQPMLDMVRLLATEYEKLVDADMLVAAVAPVYQDSEVASTAKFVRYGLLGFMTGTYFENETATEADFVISSGSLIPVASLDKIGLLDESLFIDHVDTEWCLRAKSKGYKLFGVPRARMIHSLGNERKRFWFFRWRNVAYHSPFRYYYIVRNSLLLQRRSYIPLKWRAAEFFRCIGVIAFYSIFSDRRLDCMRMMQKGIWHGIKGISGPLT